jgi:hypothetical protein
MDFKPGDIIKHKNGIVYLLTAPRGSDGSKWHVVCLVGNGAGNLIYYSEDTFKQCGPGLWTKLGSLDEL